MLTTMDRAAVRALRVAMEAALSKVQTQYGVTIKMGGARFDSRTATFKVEVVTKGKGGEEQTKESIAYEQSAVIYGLDAEWLNKEFKFRGNTFIVRGLNTRAHKMPVIVEQKATGKRFKMPPFTVVMAFGK